MFENQLGTLVKTSKFFRNKKIFPKQEIFYCGIVSGHGLIATFSFLFASVSKKIYLWQQVKLKNFPKQEILLGESINCSLHTKTKCQKSSEVSLLSSSIHVKKE